jgi:hypothetical protein
MTAVSLKTAKQTGLTIPLNVLVRAALAEVISNGKNNMSRFKGSLKPGSNPRLGYSLRHNGPYTQRLT